MYDAADAAAATARYTVELVIHIALLVQAAVIQ
jgi:hypothetical protein